MILPKGRYGFSNIATVKIDDPVISRIAEMTKMDINKIKIYGLLFIPIKLMIVSDLIF